MFLVYFNHYFVIVSIYYHILIKWTYQNNFPNEYKRYINWYKYIIITNIPTILNYSVGIELLNSGYILIKSYENYLNVV